MIKWKTSKNPIDYEFALSFMEEHINAIKSSNADDLIWRLEHTPLYTAGKNAKKRDLLSPDKLPVYESERGGQYTYHGPGQRIAYVMLNLKNRGKHRQVREFVNRLEDWIILTLSDFGIAGERFKGAPGIWVKTKHDKGLETTEKIAALGIKIKHGITYHGIAINVHPDLSNFAGIVPCGMSAYGVTSFKKLGINTPMEEVDTSLKANFTKAFDGFV
ncbi:MAG: lipoyl(octanoyl) transferase LipB [Alphaproteobacteria bacterium]|nr:lipoyl(octanoyl) transferase LipB [Alphaproteobacteria bacterium]